MSRGRQARKGGDMRKVTILTGAELRRSANGEAAIETDGCGVTLADLLPCEAGRRGTFDITVNFVPEDGDRSLDALPAETWDADEPMGAL